MQGNSLVINVYSTDSTIPVEKCGNLRRLGSRPLAGPGGSCSNGTLKSGRSAVTGMRACSACAGDYEDPDCTAWTPDEPGAEEGGVTDEFSAEE